MLLVFSPLPGWEHADLHPAIRWSKCAFLFYFCKVPKTINAQLCKVILVRTCEDSHTSGKGRNWGWKEMKTGEGF